MLAAFTERRSRIELQRRDSHNYTLPVVTYKETGVGRNILYCVVVKIRVEN